MADKKVKVEEKSKVEIKLFGGPVLLAAEAKVRLSPYQKALITILGWNRVWEKTSSKTLELLWNRGNDQRRKHRLAQLTYSLHRKVGTKIISSDGDGVTLLRNVRLDLFDYVGILESERWEEFRNFPDLRFAPRASPVSDPFDEWIGRCRITLEELLRTRAYQRAEKASDVLRWEEVQGAADVLLRVDATDRRAIHWAVEAAVRLTDDGGVKKKIGDLTLEARKVDPEWTPYPDTLDLVKRRKSKKSQPFLFPECLSLIGRDSLINECVPYLCEPHDTRARVLTLVGEPGIGKSKILEALGEEEELRGRVVLRGEGSEIACRFPLWTLEQLLRPDLLTHAKHLDDPWKEVLKRFLINESGTEWGPTFNLGLGLPLRQIQEAVLVLLQRLSEKRTLTLLLDDFQWTDTTSTLVFEHVLRRWSTPNLYCLIALRSGPEGEASDGGQMISSLPPHVDRKTVPVGGLDCASAEKLVRTFLSAKEIDKDNDRVSQIVTRGDGNPFFLIELARQTLEYDPTPGGNNRVLKLLNPIIEQLNPTSRSLLGAAAVSQQDLSCDELHEILNIPPPSLFASIAELVRHGLLESHGSSVRIKHEIVREQYYRSLPEIERSWLHRRISEGLEALPGADAGRIAYQAWKGGNTSLAEQKGLEAALEAERKGAIKEAMQFLEIVRDVTDSTKRRADAKSRMAEMAYKSRDLEQSKKLLHTMIHSKDMDVNDIRSHNAKYIDVMELSGDLKPKRAIELLEEEKTETLKRENWTALSELMEIQGSILERRGKISHLPSLLREAEVLSNKPDVLVRIRCQRLLAYGGFLGDPYGAEEAIKSALSLSRTLDCKEEFTRTLKRALVLGLCIWNLETEFGKEIRSISLDAAEKSADWYLRFGIFNILGVIDLEARLFDRAQSWLDKAERQIDGIDDAESLVILHCNQGELQFWTHDYESASAHYCKALNSIKPSTPSQISQIARAGAALANAKLGDVSILREFGDVINPQVETSVDMTMLILAAMEANLLTTVRPTDMQFYLEWASHFRNVYPTSYIKVVYYAARKDKENSSVGKHIELAVELAHVCNLRIWKEELLRLRHSN